MTKTQRANLIFALALSGQPLLAAECPAIEAAIQPFWRTKEKVYKRLNEDRYVAVSVKRLAHRENGPAHELELLGAGISETPLAFTFSETKRFENYPKMSDMIKRAHFNPENRMLDLTAAAYGYKAELKVKLDFREDRPERREILFCVIQGAFKGLSGVLRLEDLERRKTEISMTGRMAFEKLPFPEFFVRFGLEVALKSVATRMRAFIESVYQNGAKPQGK
jgi:hypothetical protein